MLLFRMIPAPKDGDPVQYVGVYVLKWKDVITGKIKEPTVAFAEATDDQIMKEYELRFGHPY